MELVKEVVGYCLRNGIPQMNTVFKDTDDNIIANVNKPQAGDTPLADEAAFDAEVQTIKDTNDTAEAVATAAANAYWADLEALKTSGQAKLIAGTPLTSDEAYVLMNQQLP